MKCRKRKIEDTLSKATSKVSELNKKLKTIEQTFKYLEEIRGDIKTQIEKAKEKLSDIELEQSVMNFNE